MLSQVIISTRDVAEGFPILEFTQMLNVQRAFILCGLPDEELPRFKAQGLAGNAGYIGGSHIGSKKEALEMLKLAADKGVHPWIETYKMKVRRFSKSSARAGADFTTPSQDAAKAVQSVKDNTVRYRAILEVSRYRSRRRSEVLTSDLADGHQLSVQTKLWSLTLSCNCKDIILSRRSVRR